MRLLGWLLLGAAFAAFLQLLLVATLGNGQLPFAFVHQPRRQMAFAFLLLALGLLVTTEAWRSRRIFAEYCGRIALLLLGVCAAFLVAESGLRGYLWYAQSRQSLDRLDEDDRKIHSKYPYKVITRRSANRNLIYELRPNIDRDFGRKRFRTNSIGSRQDRDYPLSRLPKSVRIVGLGDSGMMGYTVEQDEMYLAQLEKGLNLRREGITYEVLNLGVFGYNTHQEVESLRDKGLVFQPDIVVVGWCYNDFNMPFFIPQKGQWTRRDISMLWHLLFSRKTFADITINRIVDRDGFSEETLPAAVRDGVGIEGVRRALTDLRELGKSNGFHVLVFGPIQERAVEICRSLGIPYFNTLEKIPADRYPAEWKVHDMHPSPEGHRVLAECLEAELQRLGWLVPRNP